MRETCYDMRIGNVGGRSVEEGIVRRTERRIVRKMCGVKFYR